MKVFNENPFRVIGIKANATAPEKQKAKATISAYTSIGKEPELDFDLCPPLQKIARTKDLVDLKSNMILSDKDKLVNALFWFVSGGTIDDIALTNLTKSKDMDKALGNFEAGSNGYMVNAKSICSIINHSTLEIITYKEHKSESRLQRAINAKLEIAGSDQHLTTLLTFLNPENSTARSSDIKPEAIESIKKILKDFFPRRTEDLLYKKYFANQQDVIQQITERNNKKTIQALNEAINECDNQRNRILSTKTGANLIKEGARIGQQLLRTAKPLLKALEKDNGKDSFVVTEMYEDVFSEINFCGVATSNKLQAQFSGLADSNRLAAIALVKTAGRNCYADTVKMVEDAYDGIKHIDTPIKNRLKENLSIIRDTARNWSNMYDQVNRGGVSQSTSYDNDGCLEEIIGRVGGIAILMFILFLIGNC